MENNIGSCLTREFVDEVEVTMRIRQDKNSHRVFCCVNANVLQQSARRRPFPEKYLEITENQQR